MSTSRPLPLFRRFAEDYVVEPDGRRNVVHVDSGDGTEGALALAVQGDRPVMKAGFGRIPSDGQKYFAKQG